MDLMHGYRHCMSISMQCQTYFVFKKEHDSDVENGKSGR